MRKFIGVLLLVFLAELMPAQDTPALTVTYFISPTCKICQFYTIRMKEIYSIYSPDEVSFRAFMVGPLVTSQDAIEFRDKYSLPFPVVVDTTSIHNQYDATITPEVFLEGRNGAILYHGRIDDSYVSLGKKRPKPRNHDLVNALNEARVGRPVTTAFVPAVGCIIEK